MRKTMMLYVFAALFFVVSVAIHILLSGEPRVTFYSDLIAVIVALLPVIGFVYAYTYFEKGRPEKRVTLIFIAGLLSWLGGETLWFYYEGLMETNPFPSAADILWMIGYPLILVGLFLQYRSLKVRLERKYEIGLGVVTLIISAVIILSLGLMITTSEEFTFLDEFISMVYPVGDLLLLYFALLLCALYWKGKLSQAWLLIALGFILYAVGDVWFIYLEWLEIYPEVSWHPVDFTWLLGDLLVFVGAVKYRILFDEI